MKYKEWPKLKTIDLQQNESVPLAWIDNSPSNVNKKISTENSARKNSSVGVEKKTSSWTTSTSNSPIQKFMSIIIFYK